MGKVGVQQKKVHADPVVAKGSNRKALRQQRVNSEGLFKAVFKPYHFVEPLGDLRRTGVEGLYQGETRYI